MLACNIILQNGVEVAAIDPVASMSAVNNEKVTEVAKKIQNKLHSVIQSL